MSGRGNLLQLQGAPEVQKYSQLLGLAEVQSHSAVEFEEYEWFPLRV